MRLFFALLLATGLLIASAAQAAPLKVVASFSILADMVHQIGGAWVEGTPLVGADSDTHTFSPTPADAKKLAEADLVIINGLGFEGWIQRLIAASGYHGKVITASTGITPRTMVNEDDPAAKGKIVTDPHAWQNLANGRTYVKNIAAALSAARPEQTAIFNTNAQKYDADLAALDTEVKTQIAAVPASKRKIITSHDAFGYFGAAYGVEFLAPEGISTEAEASARDVAKLIEQIRQQKVKQIFIENMSNPKLIEQIAKESGASMGGTLYSDSLSAANGAAPTYVAMFRNNLPKLVAAMQQNGE